MRTAIALIPFILASLLWACPPVHAAPPVSGAGSGGAEETIWALEEAYFANLYRADYDGVLALVDPRFLAWPGTFAATDRPRRECALHAAADSGADDVQVRIERAGIRVLGRRRVDAVRAARRLRRRRRGPATVAHHAHVGEGEREVDAAGRHEPRTVSPPRPPDGARANAHDPVWSTMRAGASAHASSRAMSAGTRAWDPMPATIRQRSPSPSTPMPA